LRRNFFVTRLSAYNFLQSPMRPTQRSYARITKSDLKKLAALAMADLESFFERKPATARRYQNRLLALAFCQGAAEHYVRPGRGVKDFDVWAFFASGPAQPFPYRRRGKVDFGTSKFGRHPNDTGFKGRGVDVLGRDIPISKSETPTAAIRRYLRTSPNKTPHLLALRPVVLLTPPRLLGKVIWDPLMMRGPE
jgi:hypothetical protein